MKSLWSITKVLAIFITVGPLVGLVTFAAGISAVAFVNGPADAGWLGPFILIYGPMFAYFVGAPWAFLAGLVATVTARSFGRAPAWIGPGSGVVSFAVSAVSPSGSLATGGDTSIGQQLNGFGPWLVVVVLLTHVGAAAVCWLLARRFLRGELT